MSPLPIRVVKVGGSLFDMADLPQRLQHWLAEQAPAHHVLVAGGGALVEQVRQWHRRNPLSEDAAHWMCVDLMTVTAHLLYERLSEIPLIEDDRLLCQRVGERGSTIFGPALWLQHSEPDLPGEKLPTNWNVTSDSIAARLAIVLQAENLVLLKSSLPNTEANLEANVRQLAGQEYVDQQLLTLAPELPKTQLVDFRNFPWKTVDLRVD